jgi:hypothetical protein
MPPAPPQLNFGIWIVVDEVTRPSTKPLPTPLATKPHAFILYGAFGSNFGGVAGGVLSPA